jgi:hypothetical protein
MPKIKITKFLLVTRINYIKNFPKGHCEENRIKINKDALIASRESCSFSATDFFPFINSPING